jgi:hypothetical protein
VALNSAGNKLAVGAIGYSGGKGAAFLFSGSSWSREGGVLQASSSEVGAKFGAAVSLSEDGAKLAVGAPGESASGAAQAGAAYIFTNDGSWTQTSYLKAKDSEPGKSFGAALGLSGDGQTLAIGAPGNIGAVYLD